MLIFEKGLKIKFWYDRVNKSHLIEGKIKFKTSMVANAYIVDVFKSGGGAIIVREDQIAQVMLKDLFNNDIWVDIDDLYASYSYDTVIGPDTTYNRHLIGRMRYSRTPATNFPYGEYVNYMINDEKATKAAIRESRITPKKVIFNGPATIVMWQDGTKTVVKRSDGDTDDREKAVMYAILKKQFGSRAEMNRYLKLFFKEEHNG